MQLDYAICGKETSNLTVAKRVDGQTNFDRTHTADYNIFLVSNNLWSQQGVVYQNFCSRPHTFSGEGNWKSSRPHGWKEDDPLCYSHSGNVDRFEDLSPSLTTVLRNQLQAYMNRDAKHLVVVYSNLPNVADPRDNSTVFANDPSNVEYIQEHGKVINGVTYVDGDVQMYSLRRDSARQMEPKSRHPHRYAHRDPWEHPEDLRTLHAGVEDLTIEEYDESPVNLGTEAHEMFLEACRGLFEPNLILDELGIVEHV
tara:strand:+ start:6963 stop:7727 length:765 start_codon:yes stop_codon:yes gene_type:complete